MGGHEASTERTADSSAGEPRSALVLRGVLPHDTTESVLAGARITIGRDKEANLCLERPRVSRRHAEFYRQGPIYAVRDLGSTNGTYIDGRLTQHAAVRPGMLLRIGDWLGMVEELEPADAGMHFGELAPGLFGGVRLGRILRVLERVARKDLPLVLVGATGTGKERFACAVHSLSGREGPLHAVNCAALPKELAESELFGHRRGAFTGAERQYEGHLRAAKAGTLFLDEIAELDLSVQAKLLRAIANRAVTPVGETEPLPFSARIIAATQRPLADAVREGRFREDLAARLSGMDVFLPALRERAADVPSLFQRFLREYAGGRPPAVATRVYERLCLHDWPRNVRELELLARRMLAVHEFEPELRVEHLPAELARARSEAPLAEPTPSADRNEHDRHRLNQALIRCEGNVTLAAELIGISRQRAYRLMRAAAPSEAVAEPPERSE